jgi:hypothetical protein
MNETELLDVGLRLMKAQELIARGKQGRALDELWEAEALARGTADAIRKLLSFTSAFAQQVEPRKRSRLADLVAVLEHDAVALREWDGKLTASAQNENANGLPDGGPSRLLGCAGAMLFASVVAAATWSTFDGGLFCTSTVHQGANINHAFGVVFLSGLAGSVLLLFVRKRRRLGGALLLLVAAAMLAGLVLVTVDSARYVALQDCGFMSDTYRRFNDTVYYLYALWGVPAAFLVWTAIRRFANGTTVPVGSD